MYITNYYKAVKYRIFLGISTDIAVRFLIFNIQ